MVRAGKIGESEEFALENDVAVIGWDELPDLSSVQSREGIKALLAPTPHYVDSKPQRLAKDTGQVWAFKESIHVGDLIVLPLKTRYAIAIGKAVGPYTYRGGNPSGAKHTRPVEWLRKDVPRSSFQQDVLYSLGAYTTVCQIQRNQAENRIRAVSRGEQDPGLGPQPEISTDEQQVPQDLEEFAADQIRSRIATRFCGHEFARLIGALLDAQGYQTHVSSPGPDGGVDIIAGREPMGFGLPRLCVQVKSNDQPVGVDVLHQLQGAMGNFGADQGLLVSWSGFKQTVRNEARQHFFKVRLWDAGDIVRTLIEQYDGLPKDIQAELPLKRIWIIVPEETE
jgi:restriction system protein